jgi:hypothetical protein
MYEAKDKFVTKPSGYDDYIDLIIVEVNSTDELDPGGNPWSDLTPTQARQLAKRIATMLNLPVGAQWVPND